MSVFNALLFKRTQDPPASTWVEYTEDERRWMQLERREKSLWKANAKMRRVYYDVELLRNCLEFFLDNEPVINDEILDMLPKEFGGRSEYNDSDLRDWNPWWRQAPLPHEVI